MCPGSAVRPVLNKIGSRIPLTLELLKQSHFKWILSIPVMLRSLSVLKIRGLPWAKPEKSPKTPECDFVKPNIVFKKSFFSKPDCFIFV